MGMKGYKGFRKGLICKSKQYAENTIFEESEANICVFCKNPMDVLDYYPLIDNNGEMCEFSEVEAMDETLTNDEKKYCTKKLKIGARLSLVEFIKASFDVTYRQIKEEVDNVSLSGITTKDVKETLKVDCVNTRIKSMQKMLNILGYSVDREDGYFSVNTQVALQQFETDNHLNVDGEYSQSDKQMLVARMMIYINNHENDKQYDQLMKIIK